MNNLLLMVLFCCSVNACSKKSAPSCLDAVKNHLYVYHGSKSSDADALKPLQKESLRLDFQLLLKEYAPGSDVIKLSDGDDDWPPCYISVECPKLKKRAVLEVVFDSASEIGLKVYSITWKPVN